MRPQNCTCEWKTQDPSCPYHWQVQKPSAPSAVRLWRSKSVGIFREDEPGADVIHNYTVGTWRPDPEPTAS